MNVKDIEQLMGSGVFWTLIITGFIILISNFIQHYTADPPRELFHLMEKGTNTLYSITVEQTVDGEWLMKREDGEVYNLGKYNMVTNPITIQILGK